MSQNDRLSKARADKRELAWVRRRLAETREERDRLAAQLAIAEQARDYEQADVDALTKGIGTFFRRVMADHADLSKEQQELAAAQLLCDELTDELRSIDADIAQLTTRENAVRDADARYAQVLAEVEAEVREQGELNEELDALVAAESELTSSRREVREAMTIGVDVQKSFIAVVNYARELEPRPQDEVEREGLVHAMMGWTRESYTGLCGALAAAQQGLRRFEQACHTLQTTLPPGIDFDLRLEPLPETNRFILRDVMWTNRRLIEGILPEVSRVSGSLSTAIGELKKRDSQLAQALAECTRVRAHLLDPVLPSDLN
ncbi:MAG TPA: hypothetical protein VMZ53_04195 [Kofleriaceae bacterium]|nr:hypothetical protein [Kofleriaceae bacterium]